MADIFEPRPPQISAIQFVEDSTSNNSAEITEWALDNGATAVWYEDAPYREPGLRIQSEYGLTSVANTAWLILNEDGSFSQSRDEYFQRKWRKVEV